MSQLCTIRCWWTFEESLFLADLYASIIVTHPLETQNTQIQIRKNTLNKVMVDARQTPTTMAPFGDLNYYCITKWNFAGIFFYWCCWNLNGVNRVAVFFFFLLWFHFQPDIIKCVMRALTRFSSILIVGCLMWIAIVRCILSCIAMLKYLAYSWCRL